MPPSPRSLRTTGLIFRAESNATSPAIPRPSYLDTLSDVNTSSSTHYMSTSFHFHVETGEAMLRLARNESCLMFSDFFSHEQTFEAHMLTSGGQRIFSLPNAGGNSVASEVLSFEVMHMAFGAQLSRTEMELEYWPIGSSITDYSVTIFGQSFGVSVTRAMKFRGVFTVDDGVRLLSKKLRGVHSSSRAVVQEKWQRQILHVWATDEHVAEALTRAFASIDAETQGNTLVFVSVAHNASWIFNANSNCK